jgi:hypothetical protein
MRPQTPAARLPATPRAVQRLGLAARVAAVGSGRHQAPHRLGPEQVLRPDIGLAAVGAQPLRVDRRALRAQRAELAQLVADAAVGRRGRVGHRRGGAIGDEVGSGLRHHDRPERVNGNDALGGVVVVGTASRVSLPAPNGAGRHPLLDARRRHAVTCDRAGSRGVHVSTDRTTVASFARLAAAVNIAASAAGRGRAALRPGDRGARARITTVPPPVDKATICARSRLPHDVRVREAHAQALT